MHTKRRPRRHSRPTRHERQSRPIHYHRAVPIDGPLKIPVTGAFTRLTAELQHAVSGQGYAAPTAIQEQAILPVLEGKDLLGCAQTGTGKTAAFALPILERLSKRGPDGESRRPIRALILSPTRELANQIMESLKTYGKHIDLQSFAIYGGVSQGPQVNLLRRGVDILVATPGRLLDLMNQRHVDLSRIEMFVLDEADRMMDMGFINDIRKIIKAMPKERQNMMFSATMPRNIRELAQSILRDPVEIHVAPHKPAVEKIDQSVCHVGSGDKVTLLKHLLEDEAISRAIVFVRTKRRADSVMKKLTNVDIASDLIHSGRSQHQRDRTIEKFRSGKTRVLVASDVVARGLDVDDISHVINFDMPEDADTYVHRIGRTGRAGADGRAISFCAHDERNHLRDIERMLKRELDTLDHPHAIPYSPSRGNDSRGPTRHRGGRNGPHGKGRRSFGKKRRRPLAVPCAA